MLAIELSTSSDWAREIRGTASIASAVIGRVASASTRSGLSAGLSSDQGGAGHAVDLVGVGGLTEDDVRRPGVADRRAGLDVRLVGEARQGAGAGLDHDLVPKQQLPTVAGVAATRVSPGPTP